MLKVQAFLIWMAIQDVVVIASGMKLVISPTKLSFWKACKIDDIIDFSFLDADDEMCYLFELFNGLNFYGFQMLS
jgi:hypothetical protein